MRDAPTTTAPTTRSPAFYRATLAVAALGIGYVVASGRFAAYLRFFLDAVRAGSFPEEAFEESFITALIWIASLAPFLYASWELGRQHVAGRRLGHSLLVGFVSVLRVAFRGGLAPAEAQAFAAAPPDRASRAALRGGLMGALLPAFFLAVAPPLRTRGGVLWLCVAGALVATMEYSRRRAAAHLRDEPRGLFHTYGLLNPARYEPRGRAFVKLQLAAMLVLAVWWLVGGALLVG